MRSEHKNWLAKICNVQMLKPMKFGDPSLRFKMVDRNAKALIDAEEVDEQAGL